MDKDITPDEIKAAREEMGLKPEKLADLLHTSLSSVYRWEKPVGHRQHKRMLGPAQVALAHILNRHRRGLELDIMPETIFLHSAQESD